MFENELNDQAEGILDLYKSCFRRRYGIDPVRDLSRADHTFCKDLIRQLGYDRAAKVIEGFLKSDHFWFKQKSHCLVSLKGNIDVVNTDLAKKERPREGRSGGVTLLDSLETAIWYFKESKMARDSYECTRVHDESTNTSTYYNCEGKPMTEEDIRRLVSTRVC